MSVSRHASYNLIGSVIPLALSFVTVPLYLHLIGAQRYGVLAISWLLLGYFGLFDLGLGRATSFRIAALRDAGPEDRAATFWSAIAVNIGMGVVGGAILWAASQFFFASLFKVDESIRAEVIAGIPLLAASVPIATMTGVLTGALTGREKFFELNAISVSSTVLFQLIPLAFAWAIGPHLVPLLACGLLTRVLAVVALALRCHVEITRNAPLRTSPQEVTVLLRYGGWISVAAFIVPLVTYVDRFIIGAILGAASVTAYAIPSQLATRLAVIPNAVTSALFPRLSAASEAERGVMTERAFLTLAGLLTAPFIGVIFVIGPFVDLWTSGKLGPEAGMIGRLLVPGMWANGLAMTSYIRLQSSGRPDRVAKMMALEILPYALGMYYATKAFGITGAAVVLSGRMVVDAILITAAAGAPTRRWQVILFDVALICAAVWSATIFPINHWGWWLSGAVLVGAAGIVALRSAPGDVVATLTSRLTALTGRPRA